MYSEYNSFAQCTFCEYFPQAAACIFIFPIVSFGENTILIGCSILLWVFISMSYLRYFCCLPSPPSSENIILFFLAAW